MYLLLCDVASGTEKCSGCSEIISKGECLVKDSLYYDAWKEAERPKWHVKCAEATFGQNVINNVLIELVSGNQPSSIREALIRALDKRKQDKLKEK